MMEQRVLTLEDLCRFCLSNKCDVFSMVPLSERHTKQFKDLTKRELPLAEEYPQKACLQCCNDLENMYSYKNLLLQRQDELDIILQSISAAEEGDYGDDIIEEYLEEEEGEDGEDEAQDLRTKFNEKPSVKNLSQTPNKSDILKLIEDIEKNNQLIYENSKPTVLWKKRKPRTMKPKPLPQQTETQTSGMRNEPLVIETPEPRLILKPLIDSSEEQRRMMMMMEQHEEEEERETQGGGLVVYRERYSCAYRNCGQSFHSEFLLKRHTKTHPMEPIMCCNQIFYSPQDYRNHKRHAHAETITCKSCGKVLKSPKTYRIHLKSHLASSERRYKCDRKSCAKAFNMKVHLENHLRIHSNVSPFQCPMSACTTAFKQKHQIRLHLRNKHNINSSIVNSSEIEDNCLE